MDRGPMEPGVSRGIWPRVTGGQRGAPWSIPGGDRVALPGLGLSLSSGPSPQGVGVCPAPPHPTVTQPPPCPPGAVQVAEVQDGVQESLQQVQRGEAENLPERERTDLKRRKLLLEV